jgi:hypothetical protein
VATEFVFMKHHIHNLRVFLSPRIEVGDSDTPLYFLFERFSEDGERVIMEHPMPESEGWTQYLSDYLVEVVTILGRWENSPVDSEHIVQPGYISTLGRHARDTELPELEFNADLQRLSFNWKRMLTTFFAEELFSNRLLAQHPVQAEIRNLPIPEPIWDPSLIVRLARVPTRKLKDAKVEVEIRVRHMRVAKYRERHGNCDSVSDQPSDLFCQEAYDSLKEFRYTMGWGQELNFRSARHRGARREASTADDDAMDEGNESDDSMDQTRHWGQMDNFSGRCSGTCYRCGDVCRRR